METLFCCFAFHVYECQRFHKKVRTEIVVYVVQNWVDFRSFIEGDLEDLRIEYFRIEDSRIEDLMIENLRIGI